MEEKAGAFSAALDQATIPQHCLDQQQNKTVAARARPAWERAPSPSLRKPRAFTRNTLQAALRLRPFIQGQCYGCCPAPDSGAEKEVRDGFYGWEALGRPEGAGGGHIAMGKISARVNSDFIAYNQLNLF